VAVSESSARRYALDPDVRLMLEVRDGNAAASAAAFEELMMRYETRVVRILEGMVGRHELAEELAQEVFLRVFKSRRTYEPGAKFATWLFTIVNNIKSNALRDRSRRPEVTLAGSESGPLGMRPMDRLAQASSGAMPARQIDKAELRDVVRMALDSLGERQRMAMLLNKFEQMSYADIAKAMELSVQAVKSLLSRARENLRQTLEPYLEDGSLPSAGINGMIKHSLDKEGIDGELSDSAVGSGGFSAHED
jgi:RNA polymerase sigma-70 factor, ECF subfamily